MWHLLKIPIGVGVVVGLLVGNIIAIGRLSEISDQIKQQSEDIAAQAETHRVENEAQTQIVIDRLDCALEFFSQQDFTKSYIQSVEDCAIARQQERTTFTPTDSQLQTSPQTGQQNTAESPSPAPPPPSDDTVLDQICNVVPVLC